MPQGSSRGRLARRCRARGGAPARRRHALAWGCAALLGTLAGATRAHVAPSPDANNRYLKLELTGRAVRLALTVYFGELPGARERARMDRDRDGTISADEGTTFGEALRAQVEGAVTVEVDGAPVTGWRLTDVGLGTPRTTGGAFSVDLELVHPVDAATHELWVDDRLALPSPGEAQARVEAAPSVKLLAAHGERAGAGVVLERAANGLPLGGMLVRFRAEPAASTPHDAPGGRRTWPRLVALAVVALGTGLWVARRRRRRA